MADNNENKQTVEEILAAAIERQHCQRPPRTITPEQLKAMAAERQSQKRRRLLRTAGFAAVFVIAVISTALIFNMITVDVGADKNAKEEIRTENGVVIEDGGYGATSEEGFVITNWDEIDELRKSIPKLITLDYVPNEYIFKELIIEQIETGDTTCEFIFEEKNGSMIIEVEEFIIDKDGVHFGVEDISYELNSSKGIIYVQENEIKRATIQIDDGICIRIWSQLPDNELIRIVEELY